MTTNSEAVEAMARFMHERCEFSDDAAIPKAFFIRALHGWCYDNGYLNPPAFKEVAAMLANAGFEIRADHPLNRTGKPRVQGVRLRKPWGAKPYAHSGH